MIAEVGIVIATLNFGFALKVFWKRALQFVDLKILHMAMKTSNFSKAKDLSTFDSTYLT